MSLWIVDGGLGFTLPVVARVDDWQENEHIDVTGADENGEWLPEPVRYVRERGTCKAEAENAKLRKLCKELLDLCYDAYEEEWGWDDDWSLAYEQAKKLGVEVDDG